MTDATGIFIGASPTAGPQELNLRRANRHGLVAGATGTGKTVTLQGIVEGFSKLGVPVFVADVKGDLSGMALAGSPTDKLHSVWAARAAEIGYTDWAYADNPVIFWDLFGEQGHPVRTTVSEMGPLLLARLMGLNDVQEGVLSIAFRVADEQGLLLLDLGDLQAMLAYLGENAADLTTRYGNVTKQSVGSIQRQLLQLESQGGDKFFGEPALDIADFIGADEQGRGFVNVLAADKLMASPKLYATFLLWLLSELFETLPEVGDPEKPKLVFFFDEAHLLFDEAPDALLDKIEQVVRLIRSKGVGVYFITQNPIDIPEKVAGQLGNRVQHALRAFTPRDQKAVKSAAETFRANPDINVETAITELKVGEALVSLLQADGSPSPVQRTLIKPPCSRVGPLNEKERAIIRSVSPVDGKYENAVDRESAEEILAAKAGEAQAAAAEAKAAAEQAKLDAVQAKEDEKARITAEREAARLAKEAERDRLAAQREAAREAARQAKEDAKPGAWDKAITSATRSASSSVGRQVANEIGRQIFGGSGRGSSGGGIAGQLVRGILGGLFKGR
ncbi:hypothetical protein ACFB49_41150 [Sphingomonas sp. DBB INV C78]|uniref:helicase HerA-like domain-containing protein n=1 Tax=Sphingomonas sp. DBB INV C78 TaxID=3349434 RepID=UPI0036D39952